MSDISKVNANSLPEEEDDVLDIEVDDEAWDLENLVYNVYNTGFRVIDHDMIVTGKDKDNILYHFATPWRLNIFQSRMILYKGDKTSTDPDRQIIGRAVYGPFNMKPSFKVEMMTGATSTLGNTAVFRRRFNFLNPSGEVLYKWKPHKSFSWGLRYICINDVTNEVVATLRRVNAVKKGGQILFSPNCPEDREFMLMVALCFNKWLQVMDDANKNGGGG